ncbi:MAG: dihydrolipoyl dehydrogenase [Desulfobacteraceae bacterium]|nr:dihydrolipoyl dehydrogenase [Desulfobacteraceae bacterium]
MSIKICILGAGPGGYVAAIRAAQLGADVTVIEKENPGGTCLNWGCIPSKIMKTTAELLERFKDAEQYGVHVDGAVSPDMTALMRRKEKILKTQIKGILGLLAHHKIRYIKGTGRIPGQGVAEVELPDGTSEKVAWDKLIISTGTVPLNIPDFPFDHERIISSNDALCLDKVPSSMVIVGGGVIGCEFACILSALGTMVTVVEALPRLLPLPSVDEECSTVLQREMKKRKIKFHVDKTVEKVDSSGDLLKVKVIPSPFATTLKEKDKEPIKIEAEKVLVCIGRKPNTKGLGFTDLGMDMDEKGWITVDDHMQTSVPGVYAIGDVLGPTHVMLAHVASHEGTLAAENALGATRKMQYNAVPGAIFTMPEVSNVGLTETQAGEQDIDYRSDTVLFRTLGKAQVIGELAGMAKIVSDNKTGRILGVHMIGPHATDLIAEGTLAVQTGIDVSTLADTIHAHPTLAEVMMEAAHKACDKAIHG